MCYRLNYMAAKDLQYESNESEDSQISSLCHSFQSAFVTETRSHPRGRGSSRSRHKRHKRGSRSISYETDSPYLGGNLLCLPSSTSHWNVVCLESLGIFYNAQYTPSPLDILDMVFDKTGSFGPLLDGDVKENFKLAQNSMSFSASVRDFLIATIASEPTLLSDMRKDVKNIKSQQNLRNLAAVKFMDSVQLMISYQAAFLQRKGYRKNLGPVPEDMFVDIFKNFAKLCGLIPVPGASFVAKKDIYLGQRISVSSEAGVILLPQDYSDNFYESTVKGEFPVVSVVQVKSLKHVTCSDERKDKTRPSRSSRSHSDCSDSSHEQVICHAPEIYGRIKKQALGQHGGELLLHEGFYSTKLSGDDLFQYLPGMIVVGTEVTFTLLKIHANHVRMLEVKDDHYQLHKNKATIFYSPPKDLLRKEDRDILLEAFSRLNNR